MNPVLKKSDELFPFWSLVDTLVAKKIKDIVTPGQYRLFDSCRRKLTCLWYIHKRIVIGGHNTKFGIKSNVPIIPCPEKIKVVGETRVSSLLLASFVVEGIRLL